MVAHEVKELANETAKATLQISDKIEAIRTGTHAAVIRACLRSHPYAHVLEWLNKLEQVGLLESVPQAGADDLDFSGNFNRAALAAAHNARG